MLYAAGQLALLISSARSSNGASFYDISEASLSLSASLGLIWLSTWAHNRSIRPSSLTAAYMLAKLIYYLLSAPVSNRFRSGTFAFAIPCSALFLLILEIQSKSQILVDSYVCEPPEATTSFFGNMLFWWINPILARGYSMVLVEDDIPILDQDTSSKSLRQAILQSWDQRGMCFNSGTLRTGCELRIL